MNAPFGFRPLVLVALLIACGDDGTGVNAVASITVTAPSTTLRVGESGQLTAAAYDARGSVLTAVTPRWSSSSNTTATVSASGLVTAVRAGSATITAEAGGRTGSLELTIVAAGAAVVSMPGFSFVPFTTTIDRGGSVSFDFPSEPHNVIFSRITGAPQDIQSTSNRTVTRTFLTSGNFPYDCTLHPGMSGVVVVR